jgi:hypothetical protein
MARLTKTHLQILRAIGRRPKPMLELMQTSGYEGPHSAFAKAVNELRDWGMIDGHMTYWNTPKGDAHYLSHKLK